MAPQMPVDAVNTDVDPAGPKDDAQASPRKTIACGSPRRSVDELRQAIARFDGYYATLPVTIQATCPSCGQVVPAEFDSQGGRVVLTYRCPACPPCQEAHADAIWTPAESEWPDSPCLTHGGKAIQPICAACPERWKRSARSVRP